MYRSIAPGKPLRRALLLVRVLVGVVLAAPAGAWALTYSFTTIEVPGSTLTQALGINDVGQIVGYFVDTTGSHGFLKTGTSYTKIDVPGSFSTFALGINTAGQIVGAFSDATGTHGFLYTGGSFTTINVPGSTWTYAYGINKTGQIVGGFFGATGDHGFLYTGGSFTTIDPPGSTSTLARGINDAGQIVGQFADATGNHGFLYTGGRFTTIDVPGSSETVAWGINDAGQIVGFFRVGSSGSVHGFLDTGGNFSTIDAPGSVSTDTVGINAAGQIVGIFLDATGSHSFVAIPETVSFASFTATLELKFGPRIDDTFALQSTFTLDTGNDGIDLSQDDVTLKLTHGAASFTTIIPAGSFKQGKTGRFTFEGTINSVNLEAKITPLGGNQYEFKVGGKHADLTGIANSVTVTLTIGDDSGTTTVTAQIQ